jgi:phospholipid transport system substrate-binding protein
MNIAIKASRLAHLMMAALILPAGITLAGTPTDQVKSTIDEILLVLEDPAFAGDEAITARRARLSELARERIDWQTVRRASLGKHWRARTAEEKEAFVTIFTKLLEVTYTDSIAENFGELNGIEYTRERIDGPYAVVRVKLTTEENTDHSIDYTMKQNPQGGWRAIDFTIEGASLVKNYRTQFDDIIRKSSFAGLLDDLRAKLEEKS